MNAERKQQQEENNELAEFRQRVATLQEQSIDHVSSIRIIFICCWSIDICLVLEIRKLAPKLLNPKQ